MLDVNIDPVYIRTNSRGSWFQFTKKKKKMFDVMLLLETRPVLAYHHFPLSG
jgi:hypothetical protein